MHSYSFVTLLALNIIIGLLLILRPHKIIYILKKIRKESFFWQENSSDKLWLSGSVLVGFVMLLGVLIIIFNVFILYIVVKYVYHWF